MSEELTVATLRKLYSSLLEEMAPMHHEIGTGNLISNDVCIKNSSSNSEGSKNNNLNAWRWKNQGTILVNGSDDEGVSESAIPPMQ